MKRWTITFANLGSIITGCLVVVAGAKPEDLGTLSTLVPEQYRPIVLKSAFLATIVLRFVHAGASHQPATATPAVTPGEGTK